MRKLLCVVLFIAMNISSCSKKHAVVTPLKPDPFIATIKKIASSVVPVVCADAKPNRPWTLVSIEGTAFFVSQSGAFVTANHVINGITSVQRTKPCPISAVYVPKNGWGYEVNEFSIEYIRFVPNGCLTEDAADLAVCFPIGNFKQMIGNDAVPITLEQTLQPEGTPVAFSGFPLDFTQPLTSRGNIAAYANVREPGEPFDMVIDKGAWPGASGSPVYLVNGRVVGMILARGTGAGQGISFARTSSYLVRFLAGTLKAGEKQQPNSK